MSLIDSTKSNSCFESISVGSQIIHYIDNIANEILHFLGKSWRQLYNLYSVIYQKIEGNWLEGREGEAEKKEDGEWERGRKKK